MTTVACCQLNIIWENKQANHRKVRAMLEASAPPPGSLVLLPEMFATGFSMNVPAIRDDLAEHTQRFLSELSSELRVSLLAGLVNAGPDGRGMNLAVAYNAEGRRLATYHKIHPFTFGQESRHYVGGSRIITFTWAGAVVCPFVCYDLRFPEVFRIAARRGTTLFAVIANWPAARESHWLTLLRARAIENQAYVAAVNRCGDDPALAYSGRSVIIDPRGLILADAGNEERIIRADLDLESLAQYRDQFPALKDMHDEFLGR